MKAKRQTPIARRQTNQPMRETSKNESSNSRLAGQPFGFSRDLIYLASGVWRLEISQDAF
jgi:hypothetical protein